jgi:hypothetical protein
MKQFRLKVASGRFANCYIGLQAGRAIVTSPEAITNPPVDIPGTIHAVHAQEQGATLFSEHSAKQGRIYLLALGYEVEAVEALEAINTARAINGSRLEQ